MWAAIEAAVLALLARWVGRRQGRAEQKAADQAATVQQREEVTHAIQKTDAAAPRGDADLDRRVLNGTDF